uniref:glucan endo-1,3-beta-D-glucosidase n=1 Tax=Heterosigma akashiwo TaxID=2829 RepID=A0A7S3XS68_HETAK
MGSVRHLSDILRADGAGVAAEAVYDSMKGPVDLLAGATWVLEEELPTITWYAPRKIQDEDKKQQMLAQLQTDVLASPPGAGDPYGAGKQFARMARLALIAEEHGDADSRDQAVATIVEYMDQWLEGANADPLVYETNWGGIVSSMGLQSWAADFGNGWYNDHHFHYGYFLYTLAVLIKFDPAYYSKHQGAIDLLLGDIANRDPESPLFPVARHKDFYDHHSWALGLFTTWDGKSQESSSEAVNAYYGVYLFGLATGDQKFADWGQILLSMELSAGKLYWHMTDASDIYGEPFSSNKMVGQVAENSARYRTWFGIDPQYIHCVNMLPFTPITELLMTKSFVTEEYPVLASQLSNFTDGGRHPEKLGPWMSFVYMDLAVTDPVLAYNIIANHTSVEFDVGNSLSNTYYWIFTRP